MLYYEIYNKSIVFKKDGEVMCTMCFKKNCCDGIYHSYDVHFTKFCDNKCKYCIDKHCITANCGVPDWEAMSNSIINNQEGFEDVLILGGEPCLFIDELLLFIQAIKKHTNLKVYCTSSVPKTCKDNPNFIKVLELLDGFNMSVQHYKEDIADKVRNCKSQFDRQAFYRSLLMKEKIRINLNIVKGVLDTKEDINKCLLHYDSFGFNTIKLTELQHAPDSFRSFESIYDIKMKSPYFHGCQTYIDTEKLLGIKMQTPLLLKRSCFLCEETLRASLLDGIKIRWKSKLNKSTDNTSHFGVVYEDGTVSNVWRKGD